VEISQVKISANIVGNKQMEKTVNCKGSPTFSQNLVNFDPQTYNTSRVHGMRCAWLAVHLVFYSYADS